MSRKAFEKSEVNGRVYKASSIRQCHIVYECTMMLMEYDMIGVDYAHRLLSSIIQICLSARAARTLSLSEWFWTWSSLHGMHFAHLTEFCFAWQAIYENMGVRGSIPVNKCRRCYKQNKVCKQITQHVRMHIIYFE